MKEETMDLIGEVCPAPLFKVENKIKEMEPGTKLIVENDHSLAIRNIMNLCEEEGCEFEIHELAPNIWQLEIVKC